MHWLDRAYAAWVGRPRFFAGGWGDEHALVALASHLADAGAPSVPRIRWGPARDGVREGVFDAPLPELPEACHAVHLRWLDAGPSAPVVVVCASTGDEGWRLRERWAGPLVRVRIGVLLLENPFYGRRRPPGQEGSALRTVAEQLLMNRAAIVEARALLAWLRADRGDATVAGYSMGGSTAAYAAALLPFPVGVMAGATGASPAPILTRGLLSRQVRWDRLGDGARERLFAAIDAVSLDRLPPPVAPDRAVLVAARQDGYVDADTVERLHAHWPGSRLRWVDAGHVSLLVRHAATLRRAIADVCR